MRPALIEGLAAIIALVRSVRGGTAFRVRLDYFKAKKRVRNGPINAALVANKQRGLGAISTTSFHR